MIQTMKQINFFLITIVGILMFALSSCSSSQTFTVQGTPGTIISGPDNKQLAVIEASGMATIKLHRDEGYLHFLQAKTPGSRSAIPFALDYKNRSSKPEDAVNAIGKVGAFLGGAGIVVGTILGAAAGNDKNDKSMKSTGLTLALSGLGAFLIGGGFALGSNVDGINYDYNLEKIQKTNEDLIR